ncbi:type IV secretion system protein VirB2 [Rhizobium sp. RU33A]|uniref:TrbC/VirB2 family protein n=1 Tax=Rhizobium sp. RU33A TaxID=1907413 RepID=UPI000957104E|nr:TrbC/VirB2 family protein [Rhizobium sp. RU33A]SIQ87813.1 type IV secretion system protein VirB2 [Rhizobium sp. RU33A]
MKAVQTMNVASTAVATFIETRTAHASSGGGLPWEAPLEQIQQSITGPVAGFIALAAVAVAGGMLIFGGELNDFARRLMYVVLVAGILLGASQIVGLFGATGATLATNTRPAVQSFELSNRILEQARGRLL